MKSKLKENKGITLITLVVTIIVLLILAGITLSATKGEKGVISNAKQAKSEVERSSLQEQIELALIEVEKKYENPTIDNVREELKKEGIIDDYNQVDDETGTVTLNDGTTFESIAEDYLPTSAERYYGDASVVPTDQKYFTFELKNTNMTATITGVKAAYAGKNLYYEGVEYTTAIVDGTKVITDVVIPYEYVEGNKTYKVDKIGQAAFSNADFMGGTLPNDEFIKLVDSTSNACFKSFKIPSTVYYIGDYAFACQTKLNQVTFGSRIVNILSYAFANCVQIPNIYLGETVKEVGDGAFFGWKNTQTINCYYAGSSSIPSSWWENWNANCNATINWGQSM